MSPGMGTDGGKRAMERAKRCWRAATSTWRSSSCGEAAFELSESCSPWAKDQTMPYMIESDGTLGAFPGGCAYCGTRQANTSFVQPFSKLKLSKIPGNAESETLRVEMPACETCARWFRTTRTLLFSIGFVAITGLVWCVLLTMWLDNRLPI